MTVHSGAQIIATKHERSARAVLVAASAGCV